MTSSKGTGAISLVDYYADCIEESRSILLDGIIADDLKFIYNKEDLLIQVLHRHEDKFFVKYDLDLKEIKSGDDLLKNIAWLHLDHSNRPAIISAYLSVFDAACKDCLGFGYEHYVFKNLPFLFEDKGYIYFVEAVGSGRVKIGFSTNVDKRIASLSTACPYPLKVLKTFIGDEKKEKQIHKRFASSRINLEWFEISGALKEWIENDFIEF